MKNIKKIHAFIVLLLLSTAFNTHKTHAMEPEDVKKVGWVALAGGVILGGYAAYQQFLSYIHKGPFAFTELPKDVQNEITTLLYTGATATSLKEAGKTINALAQVNKELNTLINDPDFCLKIIKVLALKFNCTDEQAAAALQTQEAKKRLYVQRYLKARCEHYSYRHMDEQLYYLNFNYGSEIPKNYIDFDFTYSNPHGIETLLMVCSSTAAGTNAGGYDKCTAIISLIAKGINVNKANSKGITALMLAAEYQISSALYALLEIPEASEKLKEMKQGLPTANIDQQDNLGNTALLHGITTTQRYGVDPNVIIKLLLDAGADPELANYAGLTPLIAAQARNNQAIIDLIQEAIEKKHENK